jgi:type III secretory pathway component EscT
MTAWASAGWAAPAADVQGLLSALLADVADLPAWGLSAARMLPAVTLIPAFGLAAVAVPIRIALSLSLAIVVLPSMEPSLATDQSFAIAFGRELLRGLPLALEVSAVLWAASMAGGLIDNLRGARESSSLPTLEEPAPPLAALLGLLAAVLFLEGGGAARIAAALVATPDTSGSLMLGVALELARSVEVAVAIAAPLAAVSIVTEVALALVARAASPAHILALVAPLRSVVLLAVAALVLERMAALIALLVGAAAR